MASELNVEAQRRRATIEGLPAEVLELVMNHIDAREDKNRWKPQYGLKNFHSLCLSTRKLNATATPFLYRVFYSSHKDEPMLLRFVRAIAQSPQLALHVRRVDIRAIYGDAIDLPPRDAIAFLEATRALTSDGTFLTAMDHALRGRRCESLIVLLLLLTTRVEYLNLDFPVTEVEPRYLVGPNQLLPWLFRLVAKAEPPSHFSSVFARVRRLRLEPVQPFFKYISFAYEALSALIAFGKVDSLIITHVDIRLPPTERLDSHRILYLKRIQLLECNLSTGNVVSLLDLCHGLHEFSIGYRSRLGVTSDFNFAVIGRALEAHAHSLRLLKIDTRWSDYIFLPPCEGLSLSLRTLTKLETLDIDDRVIYGAVRQTAPYEHSRSPEGLRGCLPPSLRHLTLHTGHVATLLPLVLRALATDNTAPDLCRMTLSLTDDSGDTDDGLMHSDEALDDIIFEEPFSTLSLESHPHFSFGAIFYLRLERPGLMAHLVEFSRKWAALERATREGKVRLSRILL